jgi:hypothetical protein
MNMRSQENNNGTNEKQTGDTIRLTTTGSVYSSDRVKRLASPHQDTHEQIHHHKTLCRNRLHNYLRCTIDMPSTTDFLSLCFHRVCLFISTNFTNFSSTSHKRPQICVSKPSQNLPKKNSPSSVHRTLLLKVAQVLPEWSDLAP